MIHISGQAPVLWVGVYVHLPPAPGGKGGLPSSSLCWSKSHGGQDLRAQAGAGLPGFQCSSSGTSCATSDKLLSLSVLQFPHL